MTPIYDITPFSALDFAGKLSAIVWFAGCNLKCDYCYNPHIVNSKGSLLQSQAVEFLRKRQGLLDGVVMSGGEPTMFAGLEDFCLQVSRLGFAIKLDTNGTNPAMLTRLVEGCLLEFVSLDFKATKGKWKSVANGGSFDSFSMSLDILLSAQIEFEVRTTLHPQLLDSDDLEWMSEFLTSRGYAGQHFVQAYRHAQTLGGIAEPRFGWDKEFAKNNVVWR